MSVAPLVGKKLVLHPAPPFPLDELRLSRAPEPDRRGPAPAGPADGRARGADPAAGRRDHPRPLRAVDPGGGGDGGRAAGTSPGPSTATGAVPAPRPCAPRCRRRRPPSPPVPVPVPARRRSRRSPCRRRSIPTSSGGATRSCRPTSPTGGRTPSICSASPRTGRAGRVRGGVPRLRPPLRPLDPRLRRPAGAREGARPLPRRRPRLRRARWTPSSATPCSSGAGRCARSGRRRPAASFAIKTDLLDSESQYKKGKALMDAGKHREALMLLEFAADCDPQNGVYAAELAYCRFLVTLGPRRPRPQGAQRDAAARPQLRPRRLLRRRDRAPGRATREAPRPTCAAPSS